MLYRKELQIKEKQAQARQDNRKEKTKEKK